MNYYLFRIVFTILISTIIFLSNLPILTNAQTQSKQSFEKADVVPQLTQFCNTTPISIPSFGTATPYPSTIAVSGLGASTTSVTVTINDANHTYRSDVNVLLVGPNGQTAMLMFGAGESGRLINANITFDDLAATQVPSFGNITGNNTYQPTSPFPINLPAPAPASPYGTTFDSFLGTNPNGNWNLYVYDDVSGDSGNINGGWCLDITTGPPLPGKFVYGSDSYRGDEGTSQIVTVNRTAGNAGAVSVDYATIGGTATAGSDFTPQTGTFTWLDGDFSPRTFSVPLLNDVSSEIDPETINLTLSNPQGGAILGTQSASIIYVKDIVSLYRNATPIILPVVGAGSLYPSTITVSGAPTAVSRVRVGLFGITHGNIADIDALLVAPNGTNFIVMSDVVRGISGVNFTLTLEDSAEFFLPLNSVFDPIYNWKPTNYSPNSTLDDFSINGGPLPPYGDPGAALVADTFASKFNGINPNGVWKLYVLDDTNGINGAINGGWGLDFLGPSAANVTVGGRIQNSQGRGVYNAKVEITDENGAVRATRTNSFGFYQFDEVLAGQTYVFNVRHKTYQFDTQVITVMDELQNIDFTAISTPEMSETITP